MAFLRRKLAEYEALKSEIAALKSEVTGGVEPVMPADGTAK